MPYLGWSVLSTGMRLSLLRRLRLVRSAVVRYPPAQFQCVGAATLPKSRIGCAGRPPVQYPPRPLVLLPYRSVYGKGNGAVPLLMIPLAASLMCTYQCISANARMLYAFSRWVRGWLGDVRGSGARKAGRRTVMRLCPLVGEPCGRRTWQHLHVANAPRSWAMSAIVHSTYSDGLSKCSCQVSKTGCLSHTGVRGPYRPAHLFPTFLFLYPPDLFT